MEAERLFDNIDDFCTELRRNGISKIAVAEINERRVLETAPDRLEVVPLKRTSLLGYKAGIVYKWQGDSADVNELSKSFDIVRRSRNII